MNQIAVEHMMEQAQKVPALEAEIERLKGLNRWAELDIAELIEILGVHPLYWNGVWQACLNETNVPVEHFKSKQECHKWCDWKNEGTIDTPTMMIKELRDELKVWKPDFAYAGKVCPGCGKK